MKTLLVAAFLFFTSNAYSENRPWTEQEKLLGATALTLHAIDISQTSYGMRQGHIEHNPLLGRQPHEDKLAGFFIVSSLLTYYLLDNYEKERKVLLYALVGSKAILVGRHAEMGIKVRF